DNIEGIVSGRIVGGSLALLCLLKWVSWTVALGSGTSGGTLAPLFTLGGALGAGIGAAFAAIPGSGVDPRMAALVGMAAMFAGASRALLASVVFAFETTQQPYGMLPLLGGCAGAYLVSCACMRHSIMTEKIARRGGRVPMDYVADHLERVLVADACSRDVVVLDAERSLADVRLWMTGPDPRAAHQGFPVLARDGRLTGVVTRRQLTDPRRGGEERVGALVERAPICVRDDATLREAADRMTDARIGRLPVLDAGTGTRVVGILTRSDLLAAHEGRLEAAHATGVELRLPFGRG
ncbi:MAG: CBS domain-containing protein, partial [Planctomycetota bacterium]